MRMHVQEREKQAAPGRDKWTAWAASLALHAALFLLLAFFGVFSLPRPSHDSSQALEVALYDADAGGGSAQAPASAGPADSAVPEISLPSEAALPEIHEDYTKMSSRQEEYRQQHQQKQSSASPAESDKARPAAAKSPVGGNGDGQDMKGKADGSGGKGDGTSAGDGAGSSQGTGSGSENGRDAAAAQRPKTPPQLMQSRNPRYPRDLEEQGIGGTVVLSFFVGSDGSVQSVSVAASSGYEAMDAAAVEAGYGYRFLPARNVYDEPVACRISKRMIFQP